jgi:hypothetical protein
MQAMLFCHTNPMVTQAANKYYQHYFETTYNLTINNSAKIWELYRNNSIDVPPSLGEYLQYLTYTPNFDSHVPNVTRQDFGYGQQMVSYYQFTNFYADPPLLTYDSLYGNCFKFNGNGTSRVQSLVHGNAPIRSLFKVILPTDGYDSFLFVGNESTLDDNLYQKFFLPNKQIGVLVMIDDQKRFRIQTDGIVVSASMQANIRLSKTITMNLPWPYSDCQDADTVDTLLSREMKRLGFAYTRDNCMVFCQQKQVIDEAGCYDARFPAILNAKPCLTYDEFNYLFIIINYTECNDYCPFECKTVSYSTSISYGTFPSVNYCYDNLSLTVLNNDYGMNFSNCAYFKDSMASVSIRFKELKYTDISDSPTMFLGDLIANIGGTMGLFVGVSVLSFVEIIELVIHLLSIYYKKLKIKKLDYEISKNNLP